MSCNCSPPKEIAGTQIVTPLSDALLAVLSSTEAAESRQTLCTRWDIKNKSHKTHGSNFSGSQTVVQLINDIITPVKGELWDLVRAHAINDYNYDINTQQMTY
jgi:hypothetical protein